jgi:glycosyltransferase involved in cell wall biosynthesis
VEEQHYDLIHAHSPRVAACLLTAARFGRPATPLVATVHNSFQNFPAANKLLLLSIFARYDRVICCGRSSLESFPAVYKWLGGRRLSHVQNGVNLARIDRVLGDARGPRSAGPLTILSVGRLLPVKNPHAVLQAVHRTAGGSARLRLIGQGPLADRLEEQRRECGLEQRVELTGLMPRDDVYAALRQADLFVSASRGEGLPVAAMEAMACRCPVILSDIPPHRELAEGADCIPLVAPDDVEGFARQIDRFERMPASQRRQLGDRCRQHVQERFSLDRMHGAYLDVYREVAHANDARRRAA